MKLSVVITQNEGLSGTKISCPTQEIVVKNLSAVGEGIERLLFRLLATYPLNYYSPLEALVETSKGTILLYTRKGTGIPSANNWELSSQTGRP
jgi:hypothetical protein